MAVITYHDVKLAHLEAANIKNVSKADVVGKSEGWQDHTLRVFRLGPGGYTPHHQHDWEHINHVIRGRGRLRIGDQIFELSEKDFAVVPANTMHQFENPFETDFEFICIVPNRGAY